MVQREQIYRPLFGTRWRPASGVRAWQSADHLLIVEGRFFSEQYTRLFWADIQSAVLYQLHSRSSFLLGAEAVCLLAVLGPLAFRNYGWPLIAGVVFLLWYGSWRFTRRHWGCQVATRTSTRQFALTGNLASSRRILEQLRDRVSLAQGAPAEPTETPMQQTAAFSGRQFPRQPVTAVHVTAFVLGILSPFSVFIFVAYCIALTAAWFLQQDFRFPLAVRSAAVMSQIYAALRVAIWILVHISIRFNFMPFFFNYWQFGMPQVLFSLYGITAVYGRSIAAAKRQQNSATVLGLR